MSGFGSEESDLEWALGNSHIGDTYFSSDEGKSISSGSNSPCHSRQTSASFVQGSWGGSEISSYVIEEASEEGWQERERYLFNRPHRAEDEILRMRYAASLRKSVGKCRDRDFALVDDAARIGAGKRRRLDQKIYERRIRSALRAGKRKDSEATLCLAEVALTETGEREMGNEVGRLSGGGNANDDELFTSCLRQIGEEADLNLEDSR